MRDFDRIDGGHVGLGTQMQRTRRSLRVGAPSGPGRVALLNTLVLLYRSTMFGEQSARAFRFFHFNRSLFRPSERIAVVGDRDIREGLGRECDGRRCCGEGLGRLLGATMNRAKRDSLAMAYPRRFSYW